MSLYGLSQRTTSTTIATASWEVRSASTNKPRVMELGLSQSVGTACTYGVGRPGAIGLTPTSPQNFVAESDAAAPASASTAAIAWATGPTVPTNFNRRISTAATVGVGAILTFPRGMDISVSSSIVVWLVTTGVACDLWCVVDE